jgi:hypothetical protein
MTDITGIHSTKVQQSIGTDNKNPFESSNNKSSPTSFFGKAWNTMRSMLTAATVADKIKVFTGSYSYCQGCVLDYNNSGSLGVGIRRSINDPWWYINLSSR